MRDQVSKQEPRDKHAGESARELRYRIADRVPGLDFSEPPERKRRCRIEMCTRPLSPPRVDVQYRDRSHRRAEQDPPERRITDRPVNRRSRMFEHDSGGASQKHEQPESESLHRILGPMRLDSLDRHAVRPERFSLCGKLCGKFHTHTLMSYRT